MTETDRPRHWVAMIDWGTSVTVRHYAILAPGEVLESDDPETVVVPWDLWNSTDQETGEPYSVVHFGLMPDGRDKAEVDADRQAWQTLRDAAATNSLQAAILRIFRQIAPGREVV